MNIHGWKPSRCDICKVFGHSTAHCQAKDKVRWVPKPVNPQRSEVKENVVEFVNSCFHA